MLEAISENAEKIAASLEAEADAAGREFDAVQRRASILVMSFSIGCVLLGCAMAVLLVRSLTRWT
jgi:hypothetical protein